MLSKLPTDVLHWHAGLQVDMDPTATQQHHMDGHWNWMSALSTPQRSNVAVSKVTIQSFDMRLKEGYFNHCALTLLSNMKWFRLLQNGNLEKLWKLDVHLFNLLNFWVTSFRVTLTGCWQLQRTFTYFLVEHHKYQKNISELKVFKAVIFQDCVTKLEALNFFGYWTAWMFQMKCAWRAAWVDWARTYEIRGYEYHHREAKGALYIILGVFLRACNVVGLVVQSPSCWKIMQVVLSIPWLWCNQVHFHALSNQISRKKIRKRDEKV